MIQPLRTAHRRVFIVLAALLPAIIAGGLTARRHNPTSASTSPGVLQNVAALDSPSATWEKNSCVTKFYWDAANGFKVRIFLNPARELHDPDLLLYWATNAGAVADELSNAALLGPFHPGEAYSIPPKQVAGYLILYSLPHRKIVDRAKVEVLP
jgi:hypothetical protein